MMIIGIDEVGRGSLAGPLCVAAVAWPEGAPCDGLADSKVLTTPKRVAMAAIIRQYAAGIGIGWVSPLNIDSLGLSEALRQAAQSAYAQIAQLQASVVVDGRDKLLGDIPARYVIKADSSVPAVMAASIVAKVARDTYMRRLAPLFAAYRFDTHVGYSTAAHKAALAQFGPCELHRQSFAPVKGLQV